MATIVSRSRRNRRTAQEEAGLRAGVTTCCLELNEAGYAAEIARGQVVVSPWVCRANSDVVDALTDLLYPAKVANGWRFHQNVAVHVPPWDVRIPDLMVVPRDAVPHDDMRMAGSSTLLVVEVCSGSTRNDDYDRKPNDYARAGVPMVLIIDPLTTPRSLILMREPVHGLDPDDEREAYHKVVSVDEGAILELPAPFGVKLDTAALFS